MTSQQKIISFFLRHQEFAMNLICGNYAFSEEELHKYQQIINWGFISGNESIRWTVDLVNKYKNQLDMETFSMESPAFADINFLEEIKEVIPWEGSNSGLFLSSSIAMSKYVPWSQELIWKYRKSLNFDHLSYNEYLPWSEKLIDRFKSRWDWEGVGANNGVPWTLHLVNKYLDRLDLSSNWVLYNLCYTSHTDLIEEYHPYLNWRIICQNPNLPWIEENLMDRWKEHLNWNGLSYNKTLHKKPDFFEDNLELWMTDPVHFFNGFSRIPTIQWSSQFIDRYIDFWDWEWLCQNEGVSWNEEMIDHFKDKVQWGGREYNEDNSFRSAGGLITNENLPWSIDFLIRYEEHIDFDELWGHHVWDKAFKPYIDKKVVDTIFRLF